MNTTPVRILLVEDSPTDSELTRRAFQKVRLTNPIDVVADGEEALDYLFRRNAYAHLVGAPLPGIVLLDLNLPLLDGHGVLRAIRAEPSTHALPVVVLTSSGEPEDVGAVYGGGGNAYMKKPVTFAGLMDAVRGFQRFWLEMTLLPSDPC